MHVEVRVDPAVICPAEVVIVILRSNRVGGTTSIRTTDKTTTGLCAGPMRSLRPTERRRVNVRAGPTNRKQDSPKDVSRSFELGLARASTLTRPVAPRGGGPDQRPVQSRCRLEVAIGGGIYPAIEDTSVTNILGHADLQASRPHPASLIRRDR